MGKIGAGVGVLVIRDGRVLLGQRHADPEKAKSELQGQGTWTMPGGKLHFGESLEECASRELREETGLEVEIDDLQLVSLMNDIAGKAQFLTCGMLAKSTRGEVQVCEPEEIVRWEWHPIDDPPEPLFKPSKEILQNFAESVIYRPGLAR